MGKDSAELMITKVNQNAPTGLGFFLVAKMIKNKCIDKKEAAYIFHILSVAQCTYDNSYGEKYRQHMLSSTIRNMRK